MIEVEPPNYEDPLEVARRSKGDVKWYLKKLKTDIAFFADFAFDIELEPKQKLFAQSCLTKPHTVGLFSRQSGKSTTMAILNVHQLSFGNSIFIESYAPTAKQALKVMFARTRQFFETQPWLENEIAEIMRSGWILMHNKNCFQSQTANKESNIRGFSPSIIEADESQHIPDDKFNADIKGSGAALKNLTATERRRVRRLPQRQQKLALQAAGKKTRIWEAGTPMRRGHFYENTLPNEDIVVVMQPHWECSFIDVEYIERQRTQMPRRLFEQEYCCIFNLDEGYAFDYNMVKKACIIQDRVFERLDEDGVAYFGGLDLGQKVDHSVLSILEWDHGKRFQVFNYEWELDTPWTTVAAETAMFLHAWKPDLTFIDSTGQGKRPFEAYFMHLPKVEGWHYGPESKAELMKSLEIQLDLQRIQLWDDPRLIRQFKLAPRRVMPLSGMPQYPKAPGEHDDMVQATGLANLAASFFMGEGTEEQNDIIFDAVVKGAEVSEIGPNPYVDDRADEIDGESPWVTDEGPDWIEDEW